MKMFIIYLNMMLSLIGCNKVQFDDVAVEPEIVPVYEEICNEGINRGHVLHGIPVTIEFEPEGYTLGTYVGYCYTPEGKPPKIVIRKKHWDKITRVQQRALLAHEIGHCLLKRGHTDELIKVGTPKSLMYPILASELDAKYYQEHEKDYLDELFSNRRD